jgi:hypothetical protein
MSLKSYPVSLAITKPSTSPQKHHLKSLGCYRLLCPMAKAIILIIAAISALSKQYLLEFPEFLFELGDALEVIANGTCGIPS